MLVSHSIILGLVASECVSCLVPSAAPTSVGVLPNVTSSSITVQWGAVNCADRNGDITGYSVQYEVVGSGSPHTLTVSEGGIPATIQSVMSSTNYSIQVAAENSAGTGPYSDPIIVETQQSKCRGALLTVCVPFD